MQSIWKWTLKITEHQTLEMPEGAEILSVNNQNGSLCLWAKVDTGATKIPRHFRVIGTGHVHTSISTFRFIGTVLIGAFVWHVFEE